MTNTSTKMPPEVENIFTNYPEPVRVKMLGLRKLILETAKQLEISDLEETLKWGEPSYLTKNGSTLRIDWKKRTPDQYAIYCQCSSKLIPTFRIVFKDLLQFEGNRAIVFSLEGAFPEEIVKKCIAAGLTYHSIKNLPLLGL